MFCARLFICALWSPAGKGLTSWLSFVVSSVSLSLSHWYPGSGVVLDCIDSWSLHHYLLLQARLSLHLSKCHIIGNHVSRPILLLIKPVILLISKRIKMKHTKNEVTVLTIKLSRTEWNLREHILDTYLSVRRTLNLMSTHNILEKKIKCHSTRHCIHVHVKMQ